VSPILKLDPEVASDERELEFELAYQRGLTTAERFEVRGRKLKRSASQSQSASAVPLILEKIKIS
jgi:hypothetical protein